MFNDRLIRTWELIEDLQASLIVVEFSLSLSLHEKKKSLRYFSYVGLREWYMLYARNLYHLQVGFKRMTAMNLIMSYDQMRFNEIFWIFDNTYIKNGIQSNL